jgi:hypothetical protein
MTRKRKTTYPPPRRQKGPAHVYVPPVTPPTVARINLEAGLGRAGISVGMPVMIVGSGRLAGETAVVESLTGGVIPAATVRIQSGHKGRVRTVDLKPILDSAAHLDTE